MKFSSNVDLARISEAIKEAIQRDHGSPQITRAFFNFSLQSYDAFEINGIVWKYNASGRLIDVYRWKTTGLGTGKRTEVECQKLSIKPVALHYDPITPDLFFDAAQKTEGQAYEGTRSKAGACYRVLDDGVEIGRVAQVRFNANEAGDNPQRQWLAMESDGRIWFSYGRTREEAARYLLTDEAQNEKDQRLAA